MKQQQSQCQPGRIQQFLKDQLSSQELERFEEHLESCLSCRVQLEQSSADASWWAEARTHLSQGEPNDQGQPRSAMPTKSDHALDPHRFHIGFLGPTDDPQMLGRLGPYEIAGVIGYGGMGLVLKGFDRALNRYVAIKVLAPQLATSGAARRRFAREAQAAAAVVHENVIEIHGVAEWNQLPYLVMPYVRGASLQKRLDQEGPLQLIEILRIGVQTAAGLAAAHAQGLVHRDVKPANILLAEGVERVKLTDFGLARAADDASLTRTGVIAGTPQYMSPEQACGDGIDHRSDLFSLGSVLYTMCTGRTPFRAETSYGVLRRICESQPRAITELNPEIPRWLEQIVERLHAKDSRERFQSASEVAQLLQQCLAHVQQPQNVELPEILHERPPKPLLHKSNDRSISSVSVVIASLLLLLLGLIAGSSAWYWQGQSPTDGSQPPPVSASADSAHSEAHLPWDDGLGRELNELQQELGLLEEEVYHELERPRITDAPDVPAH